MVSVLALSGFACATISAGVDRWGAGACAVTACPRPRSSSPRSSPTSTTRACTSVAPMARVRRPQERRGRTGPSPAEDAANAVPRWRGVVGLRGPSRQATPSPEKEPSSAGGRRPRARCSATAIAFATTRSWPSSAPSARCAPSRDRRGEVRHHRRGCGLRHRRDVRRAEPRSRSAPSGLGPLGATQVKARASLRAAATRRPVRSIFPRRPERIAGRVEPGESSRWTV